MAYLGKTPSQAVRSRYYFTATGGETSLSGTDDNSKTLTFTDGNYVDVSLNGVSLVAGTDYNTTTANTIGGLAALAASDVVEVVVYDTFSVFSGNVTGDFDVSGTMTANSYSGDGSALTGINTDLVDDTTPQLGGDLDTNGNNINFGDNDKAQFGAGSDLQIYHDGSNSFISEEGTGALAIRTNGTNVNIQKTPYEPMGVFTPDGSVDLYYDNVKKFSTTSTGVEVTGTVKADIVQLGTSKWTIELSSDDLIFKFNGVAKIKFASDGEIVSVDDVTAFGTI